MHPFKFTLSAMTLFAFLFCGGCHVHRAPEEVVKALEGLRNEVTMGRSAMTNATASLKTVRDAPEAEIKPAVAKYGASIETLDSKAAGVGFVFDVTKTRADNYFADWQKKLREIGDDDLRNRTEERRAEAKAAYDGLQKKVDALRDSFRPFMVKLRDLNKALAADASSRGRTAAMPTIRETLDQESSVLKHIDELVAELDRLKAR